MEIREPRLRRSGQKAFHNPMGTPRARPGSSSMAIGQNVFHMRCRTLPHGWRARKNKDDEELNMKGQNCPSTWRLLNTTWRERWNGPNLVMATARRGDIARNIVQAQFLGTIGEFYEAILVERGTRVQSTTSTTTEASKFAAGRV
nr:hypothetical protein Iba_chr12cCG14190 [Ipomoea batatas]GME05520.1 hypothetical protein Iba_scaffold3049CG0550 [Ipomoea batatas]